MKARPLILLRRLIVSTVARITPWRLRALVVDVLKQRVANLPPDEGLRLLFNADNDLYLEVGRTAVAFGNGVHPKHWVTRYHDFFVQRIRPGECVLDVGCGNGALSADVAERSGATVVGIDIEAANIAEARRRHAHPRVVYVAGDATEAIGKTIDHRLETADEAPNTTHQALTNRNFDVVILSNVLEHIKDRVGFLKKFQSSSAESYFPPTCDQAPGTRNQAPEATHPTPNTSHQTVRFLIRVPLFERDWRVPVKQELGVEWRLDATHETEYTQESFGGELQAAGLHVVHKEVRWGEIWAEAVPLRLRPDCVLPRGCPAVCYLHPHYPAVPPELSERTGGGGVKYLWLTRIFTHCPTDANIVYAISSAYRNTPEFVADAKARGAKFVWNQDGVYAPWWASQSELARGNGAMAAMYHMADYVLYQSEFCRQSCDRFLGKRDAKGEILPNAVDTGFFTPALARPSGLVLLASGSHQNVYRLPAVVAALAALRRRGCNARLLIAGRIRFPEELHRSISELNLSDCIDILGAYSQLEAPAVYQRAHILLHTKYNDPCPSVVLEAMSCGLPVVYSASGGVPELVANNAGVGIPAPLDWQNAYPPDPELMAEAVLNVTERLAVYSEAARQRALDHFDIKFWLNRHRQVFETLLGNGPPF